MKMNLGPSDGRPASALVDAVNDSCHQLEKRTAQWRELTAGSSLSAANNYLQEHKLAPLPAMTAPPTASTCK